jgi:predicted P-loop ATPase/GTPase
MLDIFKECNVKKTGIFAAGVLFGTAGIKMLTSKDAKKLYTTCTAAVLRAKDCIMDTATTLQENAEDIYAEAQMINEERAAMEEFVEEEDDTEEVVEEENVESTDEEEADQ